MPKFSVRALLRGLEDVVHHLVERLGDSVSPERARSACACVSSTPSFRNHSKHRHRSMSLIFMSAMATSGELTKSITRWVVFFAPLYAMPRLLYARRLKQLHRRQTGDVVPRRGVSSGFDVEATDLDGSTRESTLFRKVRADLFVISLERFAVSTPFRVNRIKASCVSSRTYSSTLRHPSPRPPRAARPRARPLSARGRNLTTPPSP